MAQKIPLANIIKQISRQLSGKLDPSEDFLLPEYKIKGTGDIYCWSIADRIFTKITRNTAAYLISENYDELGRSLVYTFSNEVILIDPKELEYIGYD